MPEATDVQRPHVSDAQHDAKHDISLSLADDGIETGKFSFLGGVFGFNCSTINAQFFFNWDL